MEQVLVVNGNGDFFGECPKCQNWRKLEFAHHVYSSDNHSKSTGMYLCHVCNMQEKSVNPEKTTKERSRIAVRDYYRVNEVSVSQQMEDGKTIKIKVNKKTGNIAIYEMYSKIIWKGNIGTDYPEILYVQDGEIEK